MEMKTIKIKGNDYVQVNERIKHFRFHFPGHCILSRIVDRTENSVTMITDIINREGKVVSNGHAHETVESSQVNRTSHIENCETSAVGRALGNFGIGIEQGIATADEVEMAIAIQELRDGGGPQVIPGPSKTKATEPEPTEDVIDSPPDVPPIPESGAAVVPKEEEVNIEASPDDGVADGAKPPKPEPKLNKKIILVGAEFMTAGINADQAEAIMAYEELGPEQKQQVRHFLDKKSLNMLRQLTFDEAEHICVLIKADSPKLVRTKIQNALFAEITKKGLDDRKDEFKAMLYKANGVDSITKVKTSVLNTTLKWIKETTADTVITSMEDSA